MTESFPLPDHSFPTFKKGWVWLCGAGPGDPGLMTLMAVHALRDADVIVYDALVSEEIMSWAGAEAELIDVGKRGGKCSPKQSDITALLIKLAKENKRVLRLKGGDPFVFGRGGEEAEELVDAGVNLRVIPGISSGVGGLAAAGIALTQRDINQTVSFVTGHDKKGQTPDAVDWEALAKGSGVIVIYMGMRNAGQIRDRLIAGGRSADELAAVVYKASNPDQRVLETTLGRLEEDIIAAEMRAPSIICIGGTVALRERLDWDAMMARA